MLERTAAAAMIKNKISTTRAMTKYNHCHINSLLFFSLRRPFEPNSIVETMAALSERATMMRRIHRITINTTPVRVILNAPCSNFFNIPVACSLRASTSLFKRGLSRPDILFLLTNSLFMMR